MTSTNDTISRILSTAHQSGRTALFEHEVYAVLEALGGCHTPGFLFVPVAESLEQNALDKFSGRRVVLKIVSPNISHKTEIGGVEIVNRDLAEVRGAMVRMQARAREHADDVRGVLICEYADRKARSFGDELFVGVRTSREFGPIIVAGLGGIDTELLAKRMNKGCAAVTASALMTSARKFLDLFKTTTAYFVLSGQARGRGRIVSDEELLRCFDAFLSLAQDYCVPPGVEGMCIQEFEVNPFAVVDGKLVSLDGLCRLGQPAVARTPRPFHKIGSLLNPKSIAVVGVSSKVMNLGRIILNNVLQCGFPKERVFVVKPDEEEIDGVRCVPDIKSLPEKVDLLALAVRADQVPDSCRDIIESNAVESVILIPGGMGETASGKDAESQTRALIDASRRTPSGGPVFVGGNSMGIQSRAGNYDMFFIPPDKLPKRWDKPARRLAFVSQSGAFLITRMSNLCTLDPAYAISIGNQTDLTISDFARFFEQDDSVDVVAIYMEGFADVDGLALARCIRNLTESGKEVIFYKAGRTEAGRAATAGHTASIAGDYNVCQALITQAGGLVADGYQEFEGLVDLAINLHDKKVSGTRIAATSNAGFETVGMADSITGPQHAVSLPVMSAPTAERIAAILKENRLDRLVNVRNPLDLNPMATDAVHEACIRALLQDENIDAVVAAFVPLSPAMKTTTHEYTDPSSMVGRLQAILADTDKPLVAVIDSGTLYEPLVQALRELPMPVFRSADRALRVFGRYLCHHLALEQRGIIPRNGTNPRHEKVTC